MASRVFVVTGANRGIGFETVKELGKRVKQKESSIVLCARNPAAGEAAVSSLAKEGIKANLELLDITEEKSRIKFSNAIQKKYKHVDCLINNAGIAFLPGAKQPLSEQAKATCAVNYFGSRDDIDAAVKEYLQAAPKEWKKKGWPMLPYLFSKAAVIGLAAALAREADALKLNPKAEGVIVAAVYPGWCKTDMAGWKGPPLSAAEGGRRVAALALSASSREHGKLVVEGKEVKVPSQL